MKKIFLSLFILFMANMAKAENSSYSNTKVNTPTCIVTVSVDKTGEGRDCNRNRVTVTVTESCTSEDDDNCFEAYQAAMVCASIKAQQTLIHALEQIGQNCP